MMIKDINKKSSNVLFVIAHPDDECMFFGPAITSMTQPIVSESSVGRRKAKHVYLLCLSDGTVTITLPCRSMLYVKFILL